MHFTSWDRSDRHHPRLLAEDGPQELATFGEDSAQVAGETWTLSVEPKEGARAESSAGDAYALRGRLGRDKKVAANLAGREFAFINEAGGDWVIEDAAGAKVAQFSSRNSGVRRAIVEFDNATQDASGLKDAEVVALSWFARLLLEAKTAGSGTAIIATLVLASLAAIAALLT